jgi:hypothetical protein
MDQQRLTAWMRALGSAPSRRDIVRGLAGAGCGLGALLLGDTAEAKNRKGNKKKGKKKDKNKKRNQNQNQNQDQNQDQIPPVDTPPPPPPPVDPPPPPPPPPVCIPTCAATNPCGPNGCGGTCGTCRGNETCQNGTCICVPQCAPANACGSNGCNGSCGTCAGPTCQGTTLTTQVCDGGTCKPVQTSCGAEQVCFQNACCTKDPRPTCHKQPVSDGCGGTYPPNCSVLSHCCEGPNGDLICRNQPCQ